MQISIQADERALSDRIAGMPSFERKLAAARLVKKLGWPLTLNVVLHRHNIDRIGHILDLAAELGADRIELANTQYYGWAQRNREALLPSRAQLERAEAVVRAARERLRGQMEMIYVIPDYYSKYPKPCMGGWGRRQLTVVPNGDVLPCPTAHTLPLPRASVREHSLAWIWHAIAALPALPRNGLDAGAMPELRPPRPRLRWLPVPGIPAHRRCCPHRPRSATLSRPRDRGQRGAGRQRDGTAT